MKRVLLFLLAAAAAGPIVLGRLGFESTVLCLGSDGHVAVETASSDCCEEEPAPARQPDSGSSPGLRTGGGGDDCGPCVDVPLPRTVAARGAQKPSELPVAAAGGAALDAPAALSANTLPAAASAIGESPGRSLLLPLTDRPSVLRI